MRRWLDVPGSLTAHLAAASGAPVRVQRLSQGLRPSMPGELASLRRGSLPRGARLHTPGTHAREVVLHVGGQPLVYARSITAEQAVGGPWRALRALGSRPLAQLLYNDHWTRRSALHAMRLAPHSVWLRHVQRACARQGVAWPDPRLCWARYSVFEKGGRALRVMEVFAPGITELAPPGARHARAVAGIRQASAAR